MEFKGDRSIDSGENIKKWLKYARWRREKMPVMGSLLKDALSHVAEVKGKNVLDLGSGPAVNSEEVARMGANVDAIDIDRRFGEFVDEANANLESETKSGKIEFTESSIENFDFYQKEYVLILATNSIFFVDAENLDDVIFKSINSLESGGVFALTLLSDNDSRCEQGATFCMTSEEEIYEFFDKFGIGRENIYIKRMDPKTLPTGLPGVEKADYFDVCVVKPLDYDDEL